MAKQGIVLGKVRIIPQKTSPLMKVVVAATIVLSTVALIALRIAQWDAQGKLQVLQTQAADYREANNRLTQQIDDLGTASSIRQIAVEKLGLVDPDTIIIDSE